MLHADGSTSAGTLRIEDDPAGYVLHTADGPRSIQPVGDYAGTWASPGVDIVRPVIKIG